MKRFAALMVLLVAVAAVSMGCPRVERVAISSPATSAAK